MASRPKISLVLADVDGTLVTEQKILTERAQAAVAALRAMNIRFAITSGRPPRGMSMLFEALQLDTPVAGFNGGLIVKPDLLIIARKTLPPDVATQAVSLIQRHGLDVWVYRGNDWFVTRPDAPHVEREARTVAFQPTIVADFHDRLADVEKIVGISDDAAQMQRCEREAEEVFGDRAAASRSQPYYLDITNLDANKGAVVDYLSAYFSVPTAEIATIGDSPNDIRMFKKSGFSIAMGNASDDVKAQAFATTDSCNEEGFAKAMERFVLGASAPDAEPKTGS